MEFAKRLWAWTPKEKQGALEQLRSRTLATSGMRPEAQFFAPAATVPISPVIAAMVAPAPFSDRLEAAGPPSTAPQPPFDVGAALTLLQSPNATDRKKSLSVLCTRLFADGPGAVNEFVDRGGAEILSSYVLSFAVAAHMALPPPGGLLFPPGSIQAAHVAGTLKLLAGLSSPDWSRMPRVQLAFRSNCGLAPLVSILSCAEAPADTLAADPKLSTVWPSIRSLGARALGALCSRNNVNRRVAVAAGAVEILVALLEGAAAVLLASPAPEEQVAPAAVPAVPGQDEAMPLAACSGNSPSECARASQMASSVASALASLCSDGSVVHLLPSFLLTSV
jgi:hypothetical protein